MASVCLSVHSPRAFCNHTAKSITSIFYVNRRVNCNLGKNFSAIWPISTAQKLHEVNGYISLYLRIKKFYYTVRNGALCGWFFTKPFGICESSELYTRWCQQQFWIFAVRAIASSTESPVRPPEIHFWVCAVDLMADKNSKFRRWELNLWSI
jgi:hypothetical protein